MIRSLLLAAGLTLAPAFAGMAQDLENLPDPVAGRYILDRGHSRLVFKVNHLGFSNFISLFTDLQADLDFDPQNPTAMKVEARVRTDSLETHFRDPALNFNAIVTGPDFLDAARFPEITFTSTEIVLTGPDTADVTGDLTLHGVTRPITLQVTYNGGWGAMSLDVTGARIGFSATGTLLRSEFGLGYGVPAPGSEMGVSDAVEIEIETEFTSLSAAVPLPQP